MHISKVHKHGVHRPDTSLQRDIDADGNGLVAAPKLDIDEPVKEKERTKKKNRIKETINTKEN